MGTCSKCGRGETEPAPRFQAKVAISDALFHLNTARQAAEKMRRPDLASRIETIIKDDVGPIEDELADRY